MRKRLQVMDGERTRFCGTFVRYGTKPGWRGNTEKTLLLRNIVELESGQRVTDHLWFNLTKGFQSLGELHEGDIIEFDARVKPYRAGYWGWDSDRAAENPPRWDYKLSHPTRIKRV